MSKTKEQSRAVGETSKQLIMDTALELFAENGFENTSIASIAKKANISQGLMYNYFKSKDDLLHHILSSGIQKIWIDNLSPEMSMEDYVASVEQILDTFIENKHFFKLYSMLTIQPNVTQKISDMVSIGSVNPAKIMMDMFIHHFGDKGVQEMLLMAVILKGFPIIALFGDRQKVFPIETLKEVIFNFVKERYIANK